MKKAEWIMYCCRINYPLEKVHYVTLLDTDTKDLKGCFMTTHADMLLIVDMIQRSVISFETPAAIYLSEEMIDTLHLFLPDICFKRINELANDKREQLNQYFTQTITKEIMSLNPDINIKEDYE